VLLKHESPWFETFYSFYGHLNREKLPEAGTQFNAGQPFAWIGDFHENGNWFYHTHFQVLTQKGYESGYLSKGYCAADDLADMDSLCPSPLPLFRI
jgi:murein DD-endopeptidase MepM/ murein hydrolase activator NlpD